MTPVVAAGSDPELFGDDALRATQAALFAVRGRPVLSRDAFSQGRTWGLLDVTTEDVARRVAAAAFANRLLLHGLLCDLPAIAARLGELGMRTSSRLLLLRGTARDVEPACREVIERRTLPVGWSWTFVDRTTPAALVRCIQELHQRCRITPLPGWFLRGDGVPATTLVVLSSRREAIGAGTLHPIRGRGRLSSCIMGIGLCVDPAWRGRGVGERLNAELLLHGLRHYRAATALEVLEDDFEGPSRRMNAACRLAPDPLEGFLFAYRAS